MGFEADPKSIAKFSEEMDSLVTDARSATDYVEDWLSVTGGDARMFANVASAAAEVKEVLADNYRRLVTIQRNAAVELDKAATMYRDIDRGEAERLDQTYPAGA